MLITPIIFNILCVLKDDIEFSFDNFFIGTNEKTLGEISILYYTILYYTIPPL